MAECPHVNRDQRQRSAGGASCASNPELSGHGESGHHVGYFVCQPELNPSASLTSSAGLQSGEETAKAEQCVPDADGAREQDERTAGFLIAQHSSQNAPGADRQGRAYSDPKHGCGANQGDGLHGPTVHTSAEPSGWSDHPDVARWRKRERYSWGEVPTRR